MTAQAVEEREEDHDQDEREREFAAVIGLAFLNGLGSHYSPFERPVAKT